MKERLQGLIIGIGIGTLLVSTAFATVGTVKKELFYNDIKITVDEKEIKPTDVNGQYVEPFIIDGTTYLPVRGIASALGLDVEWDGKTNTVKISTEKKDETSDNDITQSDDIVYDVDGVKMIFVGVQSQFTDYHEYKFIVDNTTDKDIRFATFEISVNDLMSKTHMSSPLIRAGKKAEISLMVQTGPKSSPQIDKVNVIEMEACYAYHIGNDFSEFNERTPVILNFE